MRVSILVPYAYGGPERQRSWGWNADRWREALPGAELVVASPDVVGDPARFCRAQAINRAARLATGDVFVIADTDTAAGGETVMEAATLAYEGSASWVLPSRYVRLSEAFSNYWLQRDPVSPVPDGWEDAVDEEWPANVSGNVVVPREGFDAVGGFDERFEGWGWEDGSFACAISTLWGDPLRLEGHVAWHLWHPRPAEDSIWGPYAVRQRELGDRYLAAAGNPGRMRSLLAERPLA